MRKNLNIAGNLGYLEIPEGTLIQPNELEEHSPEEVVILCTGSQGEPMSALTRIAYHDHQTVTVERGDTVILSARPVPGNELRVHDTINQLSKAGAEVLHEENAAVHVSGHAMQEEIRTLYGLVRPRAVMPIHGEYRMQAANARMAQESGVPAVVDRPGRERLGGGAEPRGRADRRPRRGRGHVRRRARGRGHRRRRPARPAPHGRGRRPDHRRHARVARTARERPPRS